MILLQSKISEKVWYRRKAILFESKFGITGKQFLMHSRINRLHERALRIAYEDYESSFEELLIKDDSVTEYWL